MPANKAIEGIPAAIAAAAKAHGVTEGVVVMIVQPGERNAYDQQVSV
jgi:glutathione synthase